MNNSFNCADELNRIYVVGYPSDCNGVYGELYTIFGATTDKYQARQLRQSAETLHPELKGKIITRIYFDGQYVEWAIGDE